MAPFKNKNDATKMDPKKVSTTVKQQVNDGKLSPSLQKVLNAVATVTAQSKDGVALRKQVKAASGFVKGNAFNIHLSALFTKRGCVTYDKDTIKLTDIGQHLAERVELPTTNENQFKTIRLAIKGTKSKILLDYLADGQTKTRKEAADFLGYDTEKAPGFRMAMSQLSKQVRVLEYCKTQDGGEALRLSDTMYPFGRPNEAA